MAKDFVPESHKNLHDWANTYSNGVGAVAMGVIGDEEIGNPSNIASAAFQA